MEHIGPGELRYRHMGYRLLEFFLKTIETIGTILKMPFSLNRLNKNCLRCLYFF